WREAALLAFDLGEKQLSAELEEKADQLAARFEAAFWCEELGTYAIALDGDGTPCRVRSSNAGQLLFTGMVRPERAARVAQGLFGADFFSGWGIRTLSERERRFNPTSYHNGSVWPHDNALIALGLARYGHTAEAVSLSTALFDAAVYDEFRRLPELFCGFTRRRKRGPTAYPVACSPQAWAAAAPFALVAAATGLDLGHKEGMVRLANPALPPFVDDLFLRDVSVAGSRLDLRLSRSGDDVTTAVTRRQGKASLVIVK